MAAAVVASAPVARGDEFPPSPLWEVGVVAAGVSWPHYVGAEGRYNAAGVFPYVVYRGERIRADREGMRGVLFSSDSAVVDLGFSLNLPVSQGDNGVRRGMPDLPLSGEVGPRLSLSLHRSDDRRSRLLFRLPWRRVIDLDGSPVGWTVEPDILFRMKTSPGGWGGHVSLGFLYGSVDYLTTYYGVADRYATPERPSYSPEAGVSSFALTLGLQWRPTQRFAAGCYGRARFMAGSVVADSPLVRRTDDAAIGFWMTWTLWESDRREGKDTLASSSDGF